MSGKQIETGFHKVENQGVPRVSEKLRLLPEL